MSRFNIITLNKCSSTNDILKEKRDFYPSFTVLRCKIQSKGRGRWGREWFSDNDKGLYFSILIKETDNENIRFYPLSITLSILSFFENIGFSPEYQWPNDIYIKGKKIVGILSEGVYKGDKNYLIVGVGININHNKQDFPEEIKEKAVSLKMLKGEDISTKDISTEDIFTDILEIIDKNFKTNDSVITIIKNLQKYSRFKKKEPINIKEKGKEYKGYFLEYRSDGGILIEKNGEKIKLYEGDVLKIEK